MTPQPLSSYPSRWGHYSIFTSTSRTVDTRPEHAALVAKIIGKANFLDAFVSQMLITLLGPEAQVTFDMFSEVHQTAKNAAFQAACRRVLGKDDLDMLNAIMKFARAADKHRNKIAHWLWATCGEVEDGFLLIDPSENFRFMIEIGKSLAKGDRYLTGPNGPDLDYGRVLNYSKADLAAVVDEYDTLHRWLATLNVHVHPNIIDDAVRTLRYDQLCREPRLQAELARMRGVAPPPTP